MSEIITRDQAIERGLTKYFTGVPCRNNHVAERYVQSGTCQECIKSSRAIVLSPSNKLSPIEILTPERQDSLEKYQERQITLHNQRERKLAIEERALELKAKELEMKMAFELQRVQHQNQTQAERAERQYRTVTAKSKLMEVILFVHALDHASVSLMNWGFAVLRDPRLKIEDLAVRQMPDFRFVFRCFPEDKQDIMLAAQNLWDLRQGDFKSEIEARRRSISAELERDAEDNGQPEDDPH